MNKIVIVDKEKEEENKIVFKNFKDEYSEIPKFLSCDLEIEIGGFSKSQNIDIDFNGLKYFNTQLKQFYESSMNTVFFKNTDSIFEIEFKKDDYDNIVILGKFNDNLHKVSLFFSFDSDLSYIDQIRKQITNLENEYI